jgi:hypothetical protein
MHPMLKVDRPQCDTWVSPESPGIAYLRKSLRCRRTGCPEYLALSRFVLAHPAGVRGFYVDKRGHDISIDRDNVTRFVGDIRGRVWFR